ncbi:MAG: alpha/beta hydrolase fold domain-containing protein [Culicoidibacterales bacterium]
MEQTIPKSTYAPEGMKVIQPTSELGVKVQKDVYYRQKDGVDLRIRLMSPVSDEPQAKKSYPLLVFVQGSAWKKQDLNNHLADLQPLAKAGYVIAIIEYRCVECAIFPAQVIDTKQAVRFLVAQAQQYAIDSEQIYLGGDSSGGHTALMCYATWENGDLDEVQAPLPKIRAFLDFYGPTDFVAMTQEPSIMDHTTKDCPEGAIIGGVSPIEHPEIAARACVMNYVDATPRPPLLIIHGNQDRLVPFHQSVILYEHLIAQNHSVEFYCVDGGDHGGARFWSQPTIKTILEFLAKHRK